MITLLRTDFLWGESKGGSLLRWLMQPHMYVVFIYTIKINTCNKIQNTPDILWSDSLVLHCTVLLYRFSSRKDIN